MSTKTHLLKVLDNGKPVLLQVAEPEPDDFDQFDEMFLKLNNALDQKHTDLKEKEERLNKLEKELEAKERDLNNQENDLISLRKELEKKEASLNTEDISKLEKKEKQLQEREQQLFKKSIELDKEKIATARYNKELTERKAKLDQRAIEVNDIIPFDFFTIPPPSESNTSYPMFKALNKLGCRPLYTKAIECLAAIDTRLRTMYEVARVQDQDDIIIKISCSFYKTMFPAETYEDMRSAISDYLTYLENFNDPELNKAIKNMREKVLKRIEQLAKEESD